MCLHGYKNIIRSLICHPRWQLKKQLLSLMGKKIWMHAGICLFVCLVGDEKHSYFFYIFVWTLLVGESFVASLNSVTIINTLVPLPPPRHCCFRVVWGLLYNVSSVKTSASILAPVCWCWFSFSISISVLIKIDLQHCTMDVRSACLYAAAARSVFSQ